MKSFFRALLIVGFLSVPSAHAVFELRGWGPRTSGMGGAFSGVADDGSAVFFNPAGLRQVEKAEVDLVYLRPYTGLKKMEVWSGHGVAAYSLRSFGSIGVSWSETAVQGLYSENVLSVTYACGFPVKIYRVRGNLMLGVTARQSQYGFSLDDSTANDPVFSSGDTGSFPSYDIGALYRHGEKGNLSVGFAILDADEPDIGFKGEVVQERSYRAGVSYLFDRLPVVPFFLRPAVDGEMQGKHNSVYMGMEAMTKDKAFVMRAGGSFLDGRGRNPAMGVSYTYSRGRAWSMSLDYAFIFPVSITETSGDHSAGVRFHYK